MKWQISKIRILALLIFIGYSGATTMAQIRISGTVVDAANKGPVAAASVFISNTSKGTVTQKNGSFELVLTAAGSYDVVFQCIGYTTQVKSIMVKASIDSLFVQLQPAENQLQEVIVRSADANGWTKYGDFFLEQFIGKHPAAAYCKIKNKEAVKFTFSKSKNTLTAFATEPLIIQNDYLGYTINYSLTLFEFNYNTQVFLYQGYPLFQEQYKVSKRKREKQLQRRAEVYQGSLMHFMRSFYRNKLLENGFEVRQIITQKANVNTQPTVANSTAVLGKMPDYLKVSRPVTSVPSNLRFINSNILPSDSFGYVVDSNTALLEFPDELHVHFTERTPETAYSPGLIMRQQTRSPLNLYGLVSEIKFPYKQGVLVYANGSFFNGRNLLTSGYWAWSEKLSTMLPLDYK
ncbi:MAG: carboxypeptidase-like regulatory domain-containing protein [Bacteroidetes bacterium]|nr:MAG: carboxypeptidase-like regulatory domain-containing protein [Bacteroidota bacterium]TAE70932.1 MAG: carboxypeptidase-like regulatory domain-containing protein [Bacteroidota bacterium]